MRCSRAAIRSRASSSRTSRKLPASAVRRSYGNTARWPADSISSSTSIFSSLGSAKWNEPLLLDFQSEPWRIARCQPAVVWDGLPRLAPPIREPNARIGPDEEFAPGHAGRGVTEVLAEHSIAAGVQDHVDSGGVGYRGDLTACR